jgi:2-haloacid dehalogenase
MATDRARAVVFDLGGVLIDWNPRYLYRPLFEDDEAMEHFLSHVCSPAWNLEQDRGRSIAEGVALLQGEHPEHADLIAAYYERWDEMAPRAIHENVAVLEELANAGIPVLGLTNFSAETYPRAVARFPFFERFAGVVVSGEVGLLKPDEAIYRLLLERHGLEASRTVFVDDLGKNVAGAKAVGIDAIHFRAGMDLRRAMVERGLLR